MEQTEQADAKTVPHSGATDTASTTARVVSRKDSGIANPQPKREVYPFPEEFLKKIPKVDLHCHLDGCVRLPTLIELAKELHIELPAYTVEGLKQRVFKETYDSLEEYLVCFSTLCSVLRTPEALSRVSYELAMDCFEEGIRYLEVRFAPQLHVDVNNHEMQDVVSILTHVNNGLMKARDEINASPHIISGAEPRFEYGIIVCAMRMFNDQFSSYYCSLCNVHKYEAPPLLYSFASMALISAAAEAKETYNIPVVGLDIAGAEKGFPADNHKNAYAYAHKKHFGKTVHAGEGYGPESIFQAITDLYAERIGHGFHLFSADRVYSDKNLVARGGADYFVKSLVEYVADRRITFEVCLTSNLQTMPELKGSFENHALHKMIDARLSITLGTDNRTVSHTTILKEYKIAVEHFYLTPKQLKDMVVAGFKRSFFPCPYKEKRRYVRQCIDFYTALEHEYGIAHYAPYESYRGFQSVPMLVPDPSRSAGPEHVVEPSKNTSIK